MHGRVEISSMKRPAAMRSGTWATKTSSPTLKPRCFSRYPATKSVVSGATVERSSERVALGEHGEQVVERGADVAHVDLDVAEGRRAERDDDVAGLRGVADPVRQREVDRVEQGLGAGLLERHSPLAQRGQAVRGVVDAENAQAAVGEAQGQRQADAAQADDGDVVAHATREGIRRLPRHGCETNVTHRRRVAVGPSRTQVTADTDRPAGLRASLSHDDLKAGVRQ